MVEALEFAAQQNCKHIMWSPLYHKQWGSHCCVDDGTNGRANTYYEVYAVPSAEGPAPAPTCAAVLKHPESECGKGGKNLGGAGTAFKSVDECAEAAGQQQGCGHIQWSDYSNTHGVGWGCLCCDVESGESLQGRANIYYSLYDVTCYGSGGGDSPAATPAPTPLVCAAVLKNFESECPEGKKGKNLGGAGIHSAFQSVDECGKAALLEQQGCDHIQWSVESNWNNWGFGCLCCDVESGEKPQGRFNGYYSLYDVTPLRDPRCKGRYGNGGRGRYHKKTSLAIIIPVVVAAVLLLAAILFLVRKRVVAARQHRRESMPTVGDDKAEVEA